MSALFQFRGLVRCKLKNVPLPALSLVGRRVPAQVSHFQD